MTYEVAVYHLAKYYRVKSTDGDDPLLTSLHEWMLENIQEDKIDATVNYIKRKCDFFPKISELEKLKGGGPEHRAERAWLMLVNKSSLDNVLIHDPYAFMVVSAYGSWHEFCKHRDTEPVWSHKNFIEKYILFSDNAPVQPRVLIGDFQYHFGSTLKNIKQVEIGQPVMKIDKEDNNLINFFKPIDSGEYDDGSETDRLRLKDIGDMV